MSECNPSLIMEVSLAEFTKTQRVKFSFFYPVVRVYDRIETATLMGGQRVINCQTLCSEGTEAFRCGALLCQIKKIPPASLACSV
jgi:hypothetical protein